ncbi:MAG TPA: serine O-acetyltransferase [Microvirga sp.]|jgi:serine O-acetyltransferase|nr:serine O-acetyltransferase [Microvirga sp.]
MAHAQVRLVPAPGTAADALWERIRRDAADLAAREPELEAFLRAAVLDRPGLEDAVVHRVAERLGAGTMPAGAIERAYRDAMDDRIGPALRADLDAIVARDPATGEPLDAVLHLKGYHALVTHRLAHRLWHAGRQGLAKWLQSRSSEVFQTDIHPAARIGQGVFLDHATGIVIGETAVVDDDVSILQGVTLGGTGKEGGDRHPKIRRGVLIGAGAIILGNIQVGAGARVGAGSVVLSPVPAGTTVAGVPAKVVGRTGAGTPAESMDHLFQGEGI